MNLRRLRDILRLFEDSALTEMELTLGEDKVVLKKDGRGAAVLPTPAPTQTAKPAPVLDVETESALIAPATPPPSTPEGPDFSRATEVKSPVVGVYYEASEPGGTPFVKVGDQVNKGEVLCLIEVMKQVTEVTSPRDGQVVDICLQNGSVVEYGQTLMKIV